MESILKILLRTQSIAIIPWTRQDMLSIFSSYETGKNLINTFHVAWSVYGPTVNFSFNSILNFYCETKNFLKIGYKVMY